MNIKFFPRFKKRLILLLMLFFFSASIAPIVAQTNPSASQLTQQATTAYQSQNYSSAALYWQQAADAYGSQSDGLNQAIALSNLSLTYQQIGEWQQAQTAIDASLSILESQKNSQEKQQILAQILDIQGKLQQELGQYEEALTTWEQAEELYIKTNSKDNLIQNRINQSEALQHLGLYPRACLQALEALEVDNTNCELVVDNKVLWLKERTPLQVKTLIGLANILQVTGYLNDAEDLLQQMLQFAPVPEELVSQAQLSLANTKRAIAQKPNTGESRRLEYQAEAADYYRKAVNNAGSLAMETKALLNEFSFLIETQQWQAAESLIETIAANFNQLPLDSNAIYNQINFANNIVCVQQRNEQCLVSSRKPSVEVNTSYANQIIADALEAAKTINNRRAESYAYGNLGKMYTNIEPTVAQRYTEEALKIAQTIGAEDIAYRWDWQLARLLMDDNPTEAITYYDQAYTILNNLRGDLVALNPEIQFSFRDSVEPVYREYIDILLRDTQPSQDNLVQAREVIEALQLAELDNFFQETCIETKEIQTAAIDPEAAIVHTIILGDRIEEIVEFSGQPLRNYKTYVPQLEVEAAIDQTAAELGEPIDDNTVPSEQLLADLQQWYQWLIAPIEADLESNQSQTVVFISDSQLRAIPTASFYDGSQYLIEKYNTAFATSLQLIESTSITSEPILRVLTAGVSNFSEAPTGNLGYFDLPGVAVEIQNIQQELPAEILLNQEFTESRFNNQVQANSYTILHIATHGQFSSQAEDTFILAWDEKINVNEIDNLIRSEQQAENQPIDLLVFSACETAVGDDRATLGMAGVAIRAGARSTLASLWSVSDDATVDLMTYFYQELSQGNVSKAAALRQAQVRLLAQEKYNHPFFWSPFILLGNWL